jgi:hypothetical protein
LLKAHYQELRVILLKAMIEGPTVIKFVNRVIIRVCTKIQSWLTIQGEIYGPILVSSLRVKFMVSINSLLYEMKLWSEIMFTMAKEKYKVILNVHLKS